MKLDFRGYLAAVLAADPDYRADQAGFQRNYAQSLADLQGEGFKLSLTPGGSIFNDHGATYGGDVAVNFTKTLYNGGRTRILQDELDLVGKLSETGKVDAQNRTALLAANDYANLYSLQQEVRLLGENLERFRKFAEETEVAYRKGLRFSSYDYYSVKSQALALERELIQRQTDLLKAETEFRQLGKIDAATRLELSPLSAPAPAPSNLIAMEQEALSANHSIQAARLRRDLQRLKVEDSKALSGTNVQLNSSLGVQEGSGNYNGGTTSFYGYGTMALASLGVSVTIPIWDGGVGKSTMRVAEMEELRESLLLEKTTRDVLGNLTGLYLDYLALEKGGELTRDLAQLDRKRFQVASERFERGLEPYRSVQESLSDATLTEIELIRQQVLLQKLRLDMALLAGRRAASL